MTRVLVITSTDLAGDSVGALFIRALMSCAPPAVSFEPMVLYTRARTLRQGAFGRAFRLARQLVFRLGVANAVRLYLYRSLGLGQQKEAVFMQRDRSGADVAWVTLSSPELILLAEQIALSGTRLKVTVWDAPEYLAESLNLGGWWKSELMRAFQCVLERADSVSVVSQRMQQLYLKRYGVESIVLRLGINARGGRTPRGQRKILRLVYAGSLYAKEEWNALVQALESVSWTVRGRPVLIYFVGKFPVTGAMRTDRVVILGERSFDESLQIVAQCDIAYLPYWFAENKALVASTSFPGKMSAYVAAGVPVFFHGPKESDVADFLSDHPVGICCHYLAPEKVVQAIARLDAGRQAAARAILPALTSELSADAMAPRFAAFLQ